MNDGLTSDVRDKIINLCKAIIPQACIWLYGSRSRGDYLSNSDIDLALQADQPIGYFKIAELKEVLAATDLSYKFDIIDINSIQDKKFKENIEKEMILWKE